MQVEQQPVTIVVCRGGEYAALAARLGVRHECPECGSDAHGQPLIDGAQVSIAHASGVDLVAVGAGAMVPGPIGVDVEPVEARADLQRIDIDTVAAHPLERATLTSLPPGEQAAAILRIWVAKEAALKLAGVGLRRAPESFVVRHATEWRVDAGVLISAPIYIRWLDLPGYVAALATTHAQPQIRLTSYADEIAGRN